MNPHAYYQTVISKIRNCFEFSPYVLTAVPKRRSEMKTATLFCFIVLFVFCTLSPVQAGATLNISDDTTIDPGFGVHHIFVTTEGRSASVRPVEKKTISFGLSYDGRNRMSKSAAKDDLDKQWREIGAFAEYPSAPGVISMEVVGFPALDPDDATSLIVTLPDSLETLNNGWHIQAGYFISDWNLQPWGSYQIWKKNSLYKNGTFNTWQLGMSYFIKGHNANITIGYERFNADAESADAGDDTIDWILTGFSISY